MEWQKLIGFYETTKRGSLTKSAKTTFHTQSVIGRQMKSLGNEFNCSLFERIGRKNIKITK
jgi:DNA-binding transcriptional LysR family regulator